MDGIYLQLEPLDLSALTPEQIRAQALSSKLQRLEEADKNYLPDASEVNTSYLQRLTAKIVDNLELKLLNLHVRYEDGLTIPGKAFSVGLTLDAFTVATTDENWTEKFIARTPSKEPSSIHKLVTLSNAGLYWNTATSCFGDLPFDEWTSQMQALIFSGDPKQEPQTKQPQQYCDYLLAPSSAVSVKFTHNEHFPDSVPKYDVFLESSAVDLAVDREQYMQLFGFLDMLSRQQRLQRIAVEVKPTSRPKENPKEWWRYTFLLLLGPRADNEFKPAVVLRCLQCRERYLSLHRLRLDNRLSKNSDRQVLEAMESELPLEALVEFRKIVKRRRQHDSAEHNDSTASKTWVGWWYGHSAADVEANDVPIEDAADVEEDILPGRGFAFRLRLSSSASLALTSKGQPIVHALLTTFLDAESRADVTKAFVTIGDLALEDKFTAGAVIPNIIAVQRDDSSDDAKSSSNGAPTFEISYSLTGALTKLKIDALPLVFTLNKSCIQELLAFFIKQSDDISSGNDLDAYQRAAFLRTSKQQKKKTASPSQDGAGFEFAFEADAPKIVIPEDVCSDSGFLLLDTGHLVVSGRIDTEVILHICLFLF